MTRAPITSRSILLPSVLVGAAVVLALAQLFAAPSREAAAASLPTKAQPQTSTDGVVDEPVSPVFCPPLPLPLSEALRDNHATHRGVDSRHARPGVLLVPRGVTPGIEVHAWQALFRRQLPAAARPPLHLLFCTWLT
jgi:hypothetical protein